MNGTDVVMGWNQIAALGNLPCGQLKYATIYPSCDVEKNSIREVFEL